MSQQLMLTGMSLLVLNVEVTRLGNSNRLRMCNQYFSGELDEHQGVPCLRSGVKDCAAVQLLLVTHNRCY